MSYHGLIVSVHVILFLLSDAHANVFCSISKSMGTDERHMLVRLSPLSADLQIFEQDERVGSQNKLKPMLHLKVG